jgi:hypothetical protein
MGQAYIGLLAVGRASVLLNPPFRFERSSLLIEPSPDPVLLLKLQPPSSMSQSQVQPPKDDEHLDSRSAEWPVSTRPASSQMRRNALSPFDPDLLEYQKRLIEEAAEAGVYDLSCCTAALSSIADSRDRESGKTGSIDSNQ